MQSIARSPVFIVGLVIGLVLGVSEAAAGGTPIRILLGGGIPVAYAILVSALAPRSETVSALAGRPVDERWMQFNLNASAWAFGVSALVVLTAFVVVQASGGDYLPYAFVAAVMGVAYIGSLIVIRLRD